MKKRIIAIIVLIVLFAVIIFMTSPNLSPLYGGGLAFWAFVITVFSVVLMVQSAGAKNMVYQQQDGIIRPMMPKKGARLSACRDHPMGHPDPVGYLLQRPVSCEPV